MVKRLFVVVALTVSTLVSAQVPITVHEWGTFTTVAGDNGQAINWLPLGGPVDLPCFVERYKNRLFKVFLADAPVPLDYQAARTGLLGKVRMETPVLYFYAPSATAARVSVKFPRGVMTEWYPKAAVTQPVIDTGSLRNPELQSTIEWSNIAIQPGAAETFPRGSEPSHYYAARATDAAPLLVAGQQEKFLFYRGVAGFDVPLSAEALGNGGVRVRNLGAEPLPHVILFSSYGGRMGYRAASGLRGDVTFDAPALTGTFASFRTELEAMLVGGGLYQKEAAAMIDTWHDSWFEDGTRVFYVLPSRTVDAILPLTVTPAPASVARVFVGRMEVMAPSTIHAVAAAIEKKDTAALAPYARFLGPITERFLATDAAASSVRDVTNAAYASYVAKASSCR
jgi:hypothetical protein